MVCRRSSAVPKKCFLLPHCECADINCWMDTVGLYTFILMWEILNIKTSVWDGGPFYKADSIIENQIKELPEKAV